jgi:hypothetical protein
MEFYEVGVNISGRGTYAKTIRLSRYMFWNIQTSKAQGTQKGSILLLPLEYEASRLGSKSPRQWPEDRLNH